MSVDPRGFKTFIQAEAQSFLQSPKQVMLGATVREIAYSSDGVQVHLADGRTLKANYSICTFRCVLSRRFLLMKCLMLIFLSALAYFNTKMLSSHQRSRIGNKKLFTVWQW